MVKAMESSAARQKASVQRQGGSPSSDGFFTTGWTSPAPVLPAISAQDCPPLAEKEIKPVIEAAAKARQLKPELMLAVIRVESAFRPCAVSGRGAMGLMQIMPATAEQFQVEDPFDPKLNIEAGARYLKQLLDRYKGDLKLALAAYNAGPGRVDGEQPAIPAIQETEEYVTRILQALDNSAQTADKPK